MSSIKNISTIILAVSRSSFKFINQGSPKIFEELHAQISSEWHHKLAKLDTHLKRFFHQVITVFVINLMAPLIHLGIISIFLMVASLWTSYYYIAVIYALWWIIDYDTCDIGTRRSEWFRGIYSFFDYSLIYEGPELDLQENYVAGYHPNGIFPVGSSLGFGCNPPNLPISHEFKRWHIAHTFLFRVPIVRELLLLFGTRAASERTIDHILKHSGKGNIMAIVPGGLAEMMYCSKGKLYLKLKGRYGFIRKAIESGANLLPCLGFGETEILNHKIFPKGHIVDRIQTFCRRTFNFNLYFAYGNWFGLPGFHPNKIRLTVCIGSPVKVTKNKPSIGGN